MNRRNFLSWSGLGLIFSGLASAIAACSNNASNPQESPTQKTSSTGNTSDMNGVPQPGEFVKIGTIQELRQKGRILFNRTANTPILVIQDPANSGKLFAVDSRCTHRGCAVDWNSDSQEILCPCHGSAFQPNGNVLKGPATIPLQQFEAKIESGTVLVKVSL